MTGKEKKMSNFLLILFFLFLSYISLLMQLRENIKALKYDRAFFFLVQAEISGCALRILLYPQFFKSQESKGALSSSLSTAVEHCQDNINAAAMCHSSSSEHMCSHLKNKFNRFHMQQFLLQAQ